MTMKKISIAIISVFLFAVIFGLSTGQAAEKEKKILLKVPMAYPSALPGLGTTIIWMAERIELLSGGTLKIKIYEPGKLIPAFEMLDAVHAGKVNACYGVSG
jgi:TRAP-type mannitol/chloroaromatic compound transport system substrate-binding protein